MTMLRPAKVFKLTEEQLAAVDAGASLASLVLRDPIRIEDTKSMIKSVGTPVIERRTQGPPKKEFIPFEQYIAHRNEGLTRLEICERYKIGESHLKKHLREWGLHSKSDEAAAMREAKHPQ